MKILSKRGAENLMFNNYKYKCRRDRCQPNIKFWVCVEDNCTISMKTNAEGTAIIMHPRSNVHSHPPFTAEKVEKIEIRNAVKRKALTDLQLKSNKVIRDSIGDSQYIMTKDIKNLREVIYYHRVQEVGHIPKTRGEALDCLALLQATFKTDRGEPFLYVDKTLEIAIVTCRTNLLMLLDTGNAVFADGTFKYRPRHFEQMYTIHGFKLSTYMPLVYCFLPSKSKATYKSMWNFITMIAASMNIDLQISRIRFDFEKAAQNAVQDVFPECHVQGCRFHLGQSWYKKLNTELPSLREHYKDATSDIGKWLKTFFGLPFLDSTDVEDMFTELIADAPQHPDTLTFADYVYDYYIADGCDFPPEIWAAEPSGERNTTNGAESFHADYNKQFRHIKPPVRTVLDVLRSIQNETYVSIRTVNSGIPGQRRVEEIRRENFVEFQYQRYNNGQIDKLQYIEILGHRFKGMDL